MSYGLISKTLTFHTKKKSIINLFYLKIMKAFKHAVGFILPFLGDTLSAQQIKMLNKNGLKR